MNKPKNPQFSSGPCKKRPGYDFKHFNCDVLGRSHRSKIGKGTLKNAIDLTRKILQVPDDYRIGIVPASDTGAMEMAMWSLLGARPVDICYWESFGQGWMVDICKQLKLTNIRKFEADYGSLPDLNETSPEHDIVFTWNGTTSGVKVKNADWISSKRKGLTICDATSAVFAMPLTWDKLDVITFSWQKVLGGEGAHGVLILSPKAVERLESYTPTWPLPKIFRMTKNGKLIEGIFSGATINTPSMLAVLDYLDALEWVKSIGGLNETIARSKRNLMVLEDFVNRNEWVNFLAKSKDIRSNTSVCLNLDMEEEAVKKLVKYLEEEKIAYDLGSYRDAPTGLRIWCGATIEEEDVKSLVSCIEEYFS